MSSPFIFIAVAQLRGSPGCPDEILPGDLLQQAEVQTNELRHTLNELHHIPNKLHHTPNELSHNPSELRHTLNELCHIPNELRHILS